MSDLPPELQPTYDVHHFTDAERRERLVQALESAARTLRDAELAKQAAGKAYAQALDAFNRFVAPTP